MVAIRVENLQGHYKMLIDNLQVVRELRMRILGEGTKYRALPDLWKDIERVARKGRFTDVVWVPSHGKKPEWTAPNRRDTKLYRALNKKADTKATEVQIITETQEIKIIDKAWDEAGDRARITLNRIMKGTNDLRSRYPPISGRWSAGRGFWSAMNAPTFNSVGFNAKFFESNLWE